MNSKKLKAVRTALGLTQKEIANLIEVSDKTWHQWETGNISMHPAYLSLLKEKVMEINHMDIDSLLSSQEFKDNIKKYTLKDINQRPDELAKITHQKEIEQLSSSHFTFIDLFAGIGGIRQAFEKVGGKCIFSSEIDNFAKYTYYTNFDVVPYGDITKIEENDIPTHDVLCAGFPCQPFSHIGKREGFQHPTQGTMFHEIVRIISAKKPAAVFLENVPGLINHDNGNTLEIIIDTLNNLGYKTKHTILDSSNFGVPQKRKRFYLVGILNSENSFQFPEEPMITANIGDFIESDIDGYSISEHLQKSYLFKKQDGRPYVVDANTEGPVKTLVSSYHKIQRLTGTFVKDGPTGLRLLSENECKAIMGFPKDFIFPVSRTQMYRQMGNSVVIPVIKSIAEELKKTLSQATNSPQLELF